MSCHNARNASLASYPISSRICLPISCDHNLHPQTYYAHPYHEQKPNTKSKVSHIQSPPRVSRVSSIHIRQPSELPTLTFPNPKILANLITPPTPQKTNQQ